MSALTYIAAALKLASDEFDPIKLTPNKDDLQRLNKVIVVCCLGVTLTGKDAGCASGVVLPSGVYKSHHGGISFDFMRDARADYDPTIATLTTPNAHTLKLRGLEHMWESGTAKKKPHPRCGVGRTKPHPR